MAARNERVWSQEEQALAIWRFRQMERTYGALPATLRELAHLFGVNPETVRRLFHRIKYLERLAPADGEYVNGPRQYELRSVWEYYRDRPDELHATAQAVQAQLYVDRGPLPVRRPIEFGKKRPPKR
jgi:hypothetical protein